MDCVFVFIIVVFICFTVYIANAYLLLFFYNFFYIYLFIYFCDNLLLWWMLCLFLGWFCVCMLESVTCNYVHCCALISDYNLWFWFWWVHCPIRVCLWVGFWREFFLLGFRICHLYCNYILCWTLIWDLNLWFWFWFWWVHCPLRVCLGVEFWRERISEG